MDHLFSIRGVFDHPVTVWCCVVTLAILVISPPIILIVDRLGRLSDRRRAEVWSNYRTWLLLAPGIAAPLLLCAASAMGLFAVISLLCFREYSRATGLFRELVLSGIGVLGILALYFACVDHWYALFVAVQPATIIAIAVVAVLPDRPQGYLQRVALASVGFLLFGAGLGHLAFLVNDDGYRPVLCMLFLAVQLSDVLTFAFSRVLPGRRIFRNTSPGTTVGGQLAASVVVALLVAWLGGLVFKGTRLDDPGALLLLGGLTALGAQLGELVLDSIKRDIGIRDMATTLPGHGGFADRFTGLLLVAPAAFHIIQYYIGITGGPNARILTGPL